jgi:MSHA biogenesis protein MshL
MPVRPENKMTARMLLAAVLCALLAGCASFNPYRWSGDTQKEIGGELDKATRPDAKAAVPADVSQALLPPLGTRPPDSRGPLETRFDLAVNNAPARQVFLSLVEGTPYSLVLHPDVGGLVSLQLKGVTVPEAIEAIRRVYGYDFRRDGNRFYVYAPGLQTRIIPVNYLNFNRKGKSDTRVTTGELTQTLSTGAPGGITAGGTGSSSTTSRVPAVRVETDSQADFWKELKDTLAAMIGCDLKAVAPGQERVECKDSRVVAINPQAGLVIVRAMPDELRLVEDFLGVTQSHLNRQVILEAKIINVQLNDRYQTGINWAALGGNSTFGQVGGGTIFDGRGVSEIAGNLGNLDPGAAFSAITGTSSSAFGGVFSVAIRTADFAAFVELLKTQGDVSVLSSPRVSTLNNQKALIKVGGDEFFITGITNTPIINAVGAITGFSSDVELTPFFSGIVLDVTPNVDGESGVILHIHPSVSEVLQRNKTFTVNTQTSTLPLAVSNIQESDNVVRAQSGQIIVIGGLMKEGSTDDNASVPFLGDIPIVGNLFKHKRVTRIKSELVILLKPTVVDVASPPWTESIQGSRDRVKELGR